MDVLPLLRAMQRLFASGMNREKVRVLLGGWVDEEDDFPDTLAQLGRNMGLELSIIGRPSEAKKLDLYRAADILYPSPTIHRKLSASRFWKQVPPACR